jgi:hypothetical protein
VWIEAAETDRTAVDIIGKLKGSGAQGRYINRVSATFVAFSFLKLLILAATLAFPTSFRTGPAFVSGAEELPKSDFRQMGFR